jgi:glycerol-3-phosphate acyltransferase PlsX
LLSLFTPQRWPALLGSLIGGPALFGAMVVPPIARVRATIDYRSYGGAPLLGVKGVVIVAHGKSDPLAIQNAIRQAKMAVEGKMIGGMIEAVTAGRLQTIDQ